MKKQEQVVGHIVDKNAVYTPAEVLQILQISKSTYFRILRDGTLRANKLSGQYRILGSELLRVLKPTGKKK